MCYYVSSLGHSDAIWRHRSWPALVQEMARCLTAPSHYLNQYWFITDVLWHSSEGNFTGNNQDIYNWYESENNSLKIIAKSLTGQWVNQTNMHQVASRNWVPNEITWIEVSDTWLFSLVKSALTWYFWTRDIEPSNYLSWLLDIVPSNYLSWLLDLILLWPYSSSH